jgi:hypothetical protein
MNLSYGEEIGKEQHGLRSTAPGLARLLVLGLVDSVLVLTSQARRPIEKGTFQQTDSLVC